MFCPHCGKEIEKDAIFCCFCGMNTKVSGQIKNVSKQKIRTGKKVIFCLLFFAVAFGGVLADYGYSGSLLNDAFIGIEAKLKDLFINNQMTSSGKADVHIGSEEKMTEVQVIDDGFETVFKLYESGEYINNYISSDTLGNDLKVTIFQLDNSVIELPCPLSVFVDNGWHIAVKSAEKLEPNENRPNALELKKDNVTILLDVTNFSQYVEEIEKCAVTGVFMSLSSNNLPADYFKLPNNINLESNPEQVSQYFEGWEQGSYDEIYEYMYTDQYKYISYIYNADLNIWDIQICNDKWKGN